MSSYVFDQVKEFAIDGKLNFKNVSDGTYRIVLCNDEILDVSYSKKTLWSEISNYEIQNVGYEHDKYPTSNPLTPGSSLLNVGIEPIEDDGVGGGDKDGRNDICVCADNVVYYESTIKADSAVILKRTTTAGEYELIAVLDVRKDDGTSSMSSNGVFRIRIDKDNNGFLVIK